MLRIIKINSSVSRQVEISATALMQYYQFKHCLNQMKKKEGVKKLC